MLERCASSLTSKYFIPAWNGLPYQGFDLEQNRALSKNVKDHIKRYLTIQGAYTAEQVLNFIFAEKYLTVIASHMRLTAAALLHPLLANMDRESRDLAMKEVRQGVCTVEKVLETVDDQNPILTLLSADYSIVVAEHLSKAAAGLLHPFLADLDQKSRDLPMQETTQGMCTAEQVLHMVSQKCATASYPNPLLTSADVLHNLLRYLHNKETEEDLEKALDIKTYFYILSALPALLDDKLKSEESLKSYNIACVNLMSSLHGFCMKMPWSASRFRIFLHHASAMMVETKLIAETDEILPPKSKRLKF